MLFPIGDTQVKGGYFPYVSYAFIAINVAVFILQFITPGNLVCDFATIPRDVLQGKGIHTMITSMFMHGSWAHLLGNMMFLWIFADNIEAVVGNVKFLLFYLLGGIAASAAHIFIDAMTVAEIANCCLPCSEISCDGVVQVCKGSVPSLGASGAIAAIMGAYMVMFPKSKVKTIVFFFVVQIPAIVFLGFWFASQLMSGIESINPLLNEGGGVAWWAHIGGFVFGIVYGFLQRGKLLRPVENVRFRRKNDFV